MSATEFAELPESNQRCELVDGVVIVSPGPSYRHQKIVFELQRQIAAFLVQHPTGDVVSDVDVPLSESIVYRPDVLFLRNEKLPADRERITAIPDLIAEVVSPGSRALDQATKRNDYERAGVLEYWLIDASALRLQFFVLADGAYRELLAVGDTFDSVAIPGLRLDLRAIRSLF